VTRPRRTYAEVLLDFPSARPPLAYYLDLIPPLRERYFSIASSPVLHTQAVHITVAVVRFQTMIVEPRFGVCSNYLGGCKLADTVRVWLRKGCLRLPSSAQAPLVMIGPGTGVAPFRAFVQTRQAQRAAEAQGGGEGAAATGDAMLFFGCRHPEQDYLYASEWAAHLDRGELSDFLVAFSRVPKQTKVYVQHRMLEPQTSARLWRLLQVPDTHVYIAGAANQMPKDVRKALREVAVREGGLSETEAMELVQRLEASKRLQCETW
jgi:sulfite reductase alpha subunit-like flavoprotein